MVAVSGGVDSVVLLNVLSKLPDLELTVAHFDHGIRPDSPMDREFVGRLAKRYGLPFVAAEGRLGAAASEAAARAARYEFLHRARKEREAKAIVTAHHEDDVLETAIINLLRGTGRKGLTALGSGGDIVRPLLAVPKTEILAYARASHLEWREDSTNSDTRYLRNYVRQRIVPRLGATGRQKLQELVAHQRTLNVQLDELLAEQLNGQAVGLERQWFAGLPHGAATEVMAAWLRTQGVANFDRPTLQRAVVGAKTGRPGQKIALKNDIFLELTKSRLALRPRER